MTAEGTMARNRTRAFGPLLGATLAIIQAGLFAMPALAQSYSNPGPSMDPTPGVLTAAAYDDLGNGTRDGVVSPSSSRGAAAEPQTWPDISAPGVNVVSSCRAAMLICATIGSNPRNGPGPGDSDTYFEASGTSWSAPSVAGIVAMLFQADPAATPAQLDDALKATAYKYQDGAPYVADGPYTSSYDKGTGLVDAYAAALRVGARLANDA